MMHDNNNNHFGTVNVKFVSHHVHLAATSAQGLRPEGCEPEPEVLPGVHTCGSAQSHPEQLAKVLRPRSVPRERDVGQSGHRLFGESSSSGALDQQRQSLLGGQAGEERLLPARHVQEVHRGGGSQLRRTLQAQRYVPQLKRASTNTNVS
jgi:hypothetical protein